MTESDRSHRNNREQPDREPLVQYEDLEQATGFTQVSNAVLRCYPELSDGEKMTYAVLKSFAYVGPETFVGQETLARARSITVSTVSRHLTRLIEVGLVRVRRRGQGKTNIWIIARIPREKLEQYLAEWRPDLTVETDPQTRTCANPQVKDPQNAQARTSHDPQAEEQESEEDESNKTKTNNHPDDASSSPSVHTSTTPSASASESYTSLAAIVENSDEPTAELSTIVENPEKLAEVAVTVFGVPDQRRSILSFLQQYDPRIVARALDSVIGRVDAGEAIENPVAYIKPLVKVMQGERDSLSAEAQRDEAEKRAIARNWARSLQREWPDRQVRAILLDTYRSEEFVDAIMAEITDTPEDH